MDAVAYQVLGSTWRLQFLPGRDGNVACIHAARRRQNQGRVQARERADVPVPARDLMSREAVQRMIAEKGALVFSFLDFDRPLRHVDIFLQDNLSFEELNRDARKVVIEKRTIKIMGIATLLETKRAITPLRDKDLIDIKELEKLQGRSEKSTN
jgi:hypothetical protein